MRIRLFAAVLAVLAVCGGVATLAQGPLTPLSRILVRTDANGYLLTTGGAYTAPDGPLTTGANVKVRTDANGYLITTLAGGPATVSNIVITQGTQTTDTAPISHTATWNAAGVTFSGAKFVYTETASAAASRYLQILGGASGTTDEFYVLKGGTGFLATGLSINGATLTQSGGGATMIAGPQGTVFELSGRLKMNPSADGTVVLGNSGGTSTATLAIPTGTTNTIATADAGRSTAQTGAVATVKQITVGSSDTSYEVSANVLVTTATTHSFTVTCAYTDEGNTARTATLNFFTVAGTTTVTNTIANAAGAVPYMGIPIHIRAKAATTITIATTGTFTTVAYNVEGNIRKIS